MSRTIKNSVLIISLLLAFLSGYTQISPGELSKAHAHLEGLTNCTNCHVLGKQQTTSKCLDCHEEIKILINQNKGYHASSEVQGKECHDCHGEHFGRDFKIIHFDENSFNHNLSGFELLGKHQEIDCASCHQTKHIKNKISKKEGSTFLGLGTECLSCHDDFHQNTLSANCKSCHNQNTFRPATGFEHAKTEFPLIGKHQTLSCEKCHQTELLNGKEFQRFAGVGFSNCTSCHIDVHNNKFGNDCSKCHNESSFSEVKNLSTINHDKTDFPLRGMHQIVNCKECHAGNYARAISHNNCTDCHADYHENQFQKNGVSPDCNECHSVDGFTPSNYRIEKHNQTEFKLDGAHLATPCFACHLQDEKWNFANLGTSCINCHENIHDKVLDEKFIPDGDCKSCHSVSNWNEIIFDHNETNFQLLGKHSQVNCRSCHFRKVEGEIKQQFSNLAESCENCHKDVHFNQFEELGINDCERCHTFNDWSSNKFDHNNARFKLDGEHVELKCLQCHKPNNDLNWNYKVYKFEDITCASCHL